MDDFSPEEMREFNENLNSMNASLGALNSGLQNLSNTLNQTSQANKQAAEENEKSAERSSNAQTKKDEFTDKAGENIKTTAEKMSGALRTATGAVISFSGALVSGVEGFDKYTRAVSGFGDSAKETGDALGGFGKFLGNAVNILAEFTVVTMKQADAQNEFAKQMNRMGAVVDTTTQGLADAAREAGASAGDLQELAVIIQQSSQAVAAFGAGTSEGTAKLLKVFKLSDDQEREMRRYGYTLKEAQEQQAYYIELQRQGGINLRATQLSEKQVQERSLKYAKTLTTLSELTGIQAGQLKEEQAAIQADLRNRIRNMRDQNDIARLEQELQGDISDERRAALEAEKEAKQKELDVRKQLAIDLSILGQDQASKLMNIIGTGAFDENTKALANLGLNAGELAKRFEGLTAGSEEYNEAVADTIGEFTGGVRRNVDRFGKSIELAANAAEIGEATGINAKTTEFATRFTDEEDARKRIIEAREKVAKATEKGEDTQKDLAASLQVLETNVRTAADDFLNRFNPFTGGMSLAGIALTGLTAAATSAAFALGSMGGAKGILSNLFGKGGGGGGGFVGPNQPSTLSKIFSPRNMKIGGGVLAAGTAAYGAYSDTQAKNDLADEQYRESTAGQKGDTEEGAKALYQAEMALNAQTSRNNKVGISQGAGGVGGALGGAAAGAAIGSVVPIIGTAIGGLIGAGLGAWMGSELGEALGEGLTEVQLEALDPLSEEDKLLMSDEEKAAWEIAHQDAKDQLKAQQDAREDAKKQRELEEKAFEQAKERDGLYNKNIIGDSEVNIKMLAAQMETARTDEEAAALLKMQLEAILKDDDLSAKQQRQVEGELAKLVKLEEGKKEDKKEDKKIVAEKEASGRTLDMSPENLAKIFEADIKAQEKRDAEKLALAQAKEESVTEQITPEVVANALKENRKRRTYSRSS